MVNGGCFFTIYEIPIRIPHSGGLLTNLCCQHWVAVSIGVRGGTPKASSALVMVKKIDQKKLARELVL
jgi:hypothetical protein